MKKKPRERPIIFIQDCGTYPDDVVVCVGGSFAEMVTFLKTVKGIRSEILTILNEKGEEIVSHEKARNTGRCIFIEEVSFMALFLCEPYDDSWKMWETLLHEINHLVFNVAHRRGLEEETEAQAYLLEYLFHHIRRKLQQIEKR